MNVIATAQQAFKMLDKESLWRVALDCHVRLRDAGVSHAIVGGVAVCLQGYQRSTVDLDLLVRREQTSAIRQVLTAAGYVWLDDAAEFHSRTGIPVQFLLHGDRAGKGSEVCLPDPGELANVQLIEGLPVLSLSRLIEAKLACGLGSLRRTHRDLADVVELIAIHRLSRAYARHLHKSLRPTFRELVVRATGED